MPARPFSASAWRAAHGWPQGGWRVVTPFATAVMIRSPTATAGGGRVRTALDSVCYIQSLYRLTAPMDKKLLDIICCPLTKLPLHLLDSERLARLNAAIQTGEIRNHGANDLDEALKEALVTRDGRLVYPIRDGIPVLLEEESIDWNQIVESSRET